MYSSRGSVLGVSAVFEQFILINLLMFHPIFTNCGQKLF